MKKQTPRKMSNDFTYETLGKLAFVDVMRVVIVRTVVTPEGVSRQKEEELTYGNSRLRRLTVQPERHPANHDNQRG